jgi:hypothetical protein
MFLGIFLTATVSFLGWGVYCSSSKKRDLNQRIALELNRARVWDKDQRY